MPTLAFFSIGIFAPIFAETFHWSFGVMMGGLTLTTIAIFLCGPIVGHFIDRHGARRVAAVSLLGSGLSYMSLALSTGSIAQYYVSWAGMALLGIGATAISFTHAISGTFVVRRGLALGIALTGSGVFALIVKPFADWGIDLFGWRATIAAIGALPVLAGAPLVLWGFPRTRSPARKAGEPMPHKETGLSLKDALKSRSFWILVAAFVPISFANGAPIPNMENILRTLQVDSQAIVRMTSLIGISIIAGRLIGGWLIDRFRAPLIGTAMLIGAASGCWMLSGESATYYEASAAVALVALAAGVEYDLLAFLIAKYIGVRNYGLVYSILFGVFAIGIGAGTALLGHSFDTAGSYSPGLIACAVALLFAALILPMLGRYPDFEVDG